MFSIFILIAVPEVDKLQASFARNNAAQELDFDLRRARAESISEGTRGIFTVNAGGNSYSFGYDYLPYNNMDVPDKIIFTRKLPTNITLSKSGTTAIFFNSAGFSVDSYGALATRAFSLKYDGKTIVSGTLYSSGGVVYD